jgi:hypothetical protein
MREDKRNTICVRLPDKLWESLDRERDLLRQREPGMTITISDVIRARLIRGERP